MDEDQEPRTSIEQPAFSIGECGHPWLSCELLALYHHLTRKEAALRLTGDGHCDGTLRVFSTVAEIASAIVSGSVVIRSRTFRDLIFRHGRNRQAHEHGWPKHPQDLIFDVVENQGMLGM